ncbi:zinc finger BED domain-containing protein RICESLEEPER 2-like [Nicotiana tomentosiformis]|uniref:zinc finger BED domain-containing protein RICESLEEPER 2-like n=1 Tax=Nicotiana tomentosiformis TaxID=4098 RepID=UPI00051B670B|nr:zinc finger BED domain-containing protein RICESLEEPER 2-like [Nicotiana tomentosiformis]
MNYMCLTTHFIDKDWTLHKKILNFCPITSHKCDDMATVIIKCLRDWGLDKVLAVTVDNLDDITVEELSKRFIKWGTNIMDGNHLHMRYMAHIINLIVQESLEEVGDSVKRVRQAVRYIKQSSKRWRKFKACCLFERITYENSLCLDVPTRWDSTYLMLDVAQEFEEAFVRYGALDPGLMHYLVTYVCDDGKPAGSLVSSDWENVRHMVKILKPFYELTLKVSGSLYVTSNVHFEEICELDVVLKNLIENENVEMSLMAKKMEDKLHKYFGNPEKMKMIFIASVLDPRNKFEYVAFALVSLFGEEKGGKNK